MEDGRERPPFHGHLQFASVVNLPEAKCALEVEEDGSGSPHFGVDRPMEHSHESERNNRHFQDRDQGRCSVVRLRLSELLGSSSTSHVEGSSYEPGLGFQLCRIPGSVPCKCQGSTGGLSALPGQTLRAIDRLCQQDQNSGGDTKKRMLGQSKISQSLRKGRKISSHMELAESGNPTSLQSGRKISCRDRTRPSLSNHLGSRWGAKGQYVGDVFSGSGRVSRSVRAAGFSSREWEILKGPDGDLTRPSVLQSIKFDIDKKRLVAAMLAPPCSSFSVARDRTMVIRNKEYPWGIPELPQHEQQKIDIGNACIKSALKIISWLDDSGLPWIMENPHSSKIRRLPPVERLCNANHTRSGLRSKAS